MIVIKAIPASWRRGSDYRIYRSVSYFFWLFHKRSKANVPLVNLYKEVGAVKNYECPCFFLFKRAITNNKKVLRLTPLNNKQRTVVWGRGTQL